MKFLKSIFAIAFSMCAFTALADEPAGYYTSCEGATGAALLEKLRGACSANFYSISYDGLWSVYEHSDVDENGKIWDMYSTKRWPVNSQHCGSYQNVGDCYNREHSFPKSWFNDAKPMYSDAFHLYPTDGKVNGQRSNYPYGECANGTTLPSHGGVSALGKLGSSTFPGYSGKVFEPVDEYKGDFARSYFYMAARYNDKISGWNSDMLAGNKYPAFSSWAVELLLKWHRQDPVSQKEIDRNEAVYGFQHNRNPFIDHPELAEYVWGNKVGQAWYISGSAVAELVLPVDGSTVSFGTMAISTVKTLTVMVKGNRLTSNLQVSVSGGNVTLSRSSIPFADANTPSGTPLTLSWAPQTAGILNAVLTIRCGDLSTSVNVNGEAVDGLPALPATEITTNSFAANWIYVGDTDARDCYALHVLDAGGRPVAGYPKDVTALAQTWTVNGLEASSDYSYYLISAGSISNTVQVTTAELVPYIEVILDETAFSTTPDTPSDSRIVDLEIENIAGDVSVAVDAPFEVSTDGAEWSRNIVLGPTAVDFLIRLGAAQEGLYESSVRVSGDGYTNDQLEVTGKVADVAPTSAVYFVADGYTVAGTEDDEVVVLHNANGTSQCSNSNADRSLGAEGFSHDATGVSIAFSKGTANNYPTVWYTSGDADGTVRVYGGNTFTLAAKPNYTVTGMDILIFSGQGNEFMVGSQSFTPVDNIASWSGEADNVTVSCDKFQIRYIKAHLKYTKSYIADAQEAKATAEATTGGILISAPTSVKADVYSVDGICHFSSIVSGATSISLAPGVYIVALDGETSRLLVK